MSKVTIKVDDKNPEPVQVIAKSVIEIADAFIKIKSSRLTERAIIVLIKDLTGLPQRDIKLILNAAADLKTYYIKKT